MILAFYQVPQKPIILIRIEFDLQRHWDILKTVTDTTEDTYSGTTEKITKKKTAAWALVFTLIKPWIDETKRVLY